MNNSESTPEITTVDIGSLQPDDQITIVGRATVEPAGHRGSCVATATRVVGEFFTIRISTANAVVRLSTHDTVVASVVDALPPYSLIQVTGRVSGKNRRDADKAEIPNSWLYKGPNGRSTPTFDLIEASATVDTAWPNDEFYRKFRTAPKAPREFVIVAAPTAAADTAPAVEQ